MLKPFLLLLMMSTCFVRVEACTPSSPSSGPCCMYLFVYCDAMYEMKMNILATSLVGFYKTGFQLIALDSGSGNICCMFLCACLMNKLTKLGRCDRTAELQSAKLLKLLILLEE